MNSQARIALIAVAAMCMATAAYAQTPEPPYKWSVEIGTGWDNSISGNINSGATGTLNGLTTVALPNKYEDVYGTGLHWRFGGGYLMDNNTEIRVDFSLQSLDADLVRLGETGGAQMYAQYDDYQSFGIDVGLRKYMDFGRFRGYGDGMIGIGFIDTLRVNITAPEVGLSENITDFYDQTVAFSLGGNAGVLWQWADQFGVYTQLGIRYMTGLSEVDNLVGTGLESINDNSARWTVPFLFGVRTRF
jgi:hypothetical protein